MTSSYLTVRQAATRVGVSRQTMFRYIKEGRVSASLTHAGEKQINITELLRAFGSLQPETESHATISDRPRQSHNDSTTPVSVAYQIELEKLKAQLQLKTAELDLAKERISELKAREHVQADEKNRFLALIERQSLLLSAPSSAPSTSRSSAARATPSLAKKVDAKTPSKTAVVKKPLKVQPAPAKVAARQKAPAKKK